MSAIGIVYALERIARAIDDNTAARMAELKEPEPARRDLDAIEARIKARRFNKDDARAGTGR